MRKKKPVKVYIPVDVRFDGEGIMWPQVITWEDGRKYRIDRVSDIFPMPELQAGGCGDRYTVWIRGKQCCLYFESFGADQGIRHGRWFVERKEDPKADGA